MARVIEMSEAKVNALIPPMPRKRFAKCDQCAAAYINGVFCHETGCPNQGARWDAGSMEWVKQRKCFECGCTVDRDDPCCSVEFES